MISLRDIVIGTLIGAVAAAAGMAKVDAPLLDAAKLSPDLYKVRLENDRVRVLEYRLKPGQKEPMHSHPAGLVIVLTDGSLKNTLPDGTSYARTYSVGDVMWREPVTHTGENVGTTELRSFIVDIKK